MANKTNALGQQKAPFVPRSSFCCPWVLMLQNQRCLGFYTETIYTLLG